MSLWIGDYLKLSNEIHYLEFKLTDNQLTNEEMKETELELADRLTREGEFKAIVNSFEGLDNQILCMRYIEGKTISDIAVELNLTAQYIYNQHARIMKSIKQFTTIHAELEKFQNNYPRVRSKK